MPSTTPEKPKNETEVIAAAISVEGKPFKNSGMSAVSSLLLTPAKISIATRKPTPAPKQSSLLTARLSMS